ncbi:MAG: hypothetical protein ACRDRI_23535 [Pseudonocardiaceae bacterium]
MEIAALYDPSVPNIAQLIRRILEDGEVSTAVINSELRVQTEGVRQVQREVKSYNLDLAANCSDQLRVSQGMWPRFEGRSCADRTASVSLQACIGIGC